MSRAKRRKKCRERLEENLEKGKVRLLEQINGNLA